MNKIFYLFFFFLPLMNIQAQIHEIGVFLGGSNFIGDVGPTTYISPNEPAFGILYKWNKSSRHAYRFSYTQSKITSNDFDSKEGGRNQRGNQIENRLREASFGLEFNFFDFDLHKTNTKVTPYIFSGANYFLSNYKFNNPLTGESYESRTERRKSIAIPMILGIKSNITPHLLLAVETGARYTLTDNMDGSGDTNNNDWYVFSGVTVTYTFGNKPCYCAE
ncbi:type IX secretion system protein PorG [Flavobacterium caseinilyticum]|uniref:DUF6089 domain-containing protein n=1 Tax=Flavobacterium caseinilyticum TaxID=2541732 RepID=A0A4R5AYK9_9FLAO|nr:DUF6089 family protein [Flavobacterium caseinilyticum]TDD78618.1 hypothetical protein E0F89_03000 [Flavobacterium caseinilyticum]